MIEGEIAELEAMATLLKPIKKITKLLCDEKNPTSSLILIHILKSRILKILTPESTDTELIAEIKAAMAEDIEPR
jgi:hypothetical protein